MFDVLEEGILTTKAPSRIFAYASGESSAGKPTAVHAAVSADQLFLFLRTRFKLSSTDKIRKNCVTTRSTDSS